MKIAKFLRKAVITLAAALYSLCLINGVPIFEYSADTEGGSLTVAGRSIEFHGAIAENLRKTYSQIEEKASAWLPPDLKLAVGQIADLLDGADS